MLIFGELICFLTNRLITACGNFIHFLRNFSFVDFIHSQVAYFLKKKRIMF